ncbi:MAG: tRNA (N6-isopentenyl adenosine(37)-C2)-methylthiotransferase MiaB [Thermoguttaceae bacterium]|jgi:tRNA-2-methylthio-N6-dimethylallyladenosine synthase|nr:tRNA (N6-isopentenyl adenosine(37)-C2)-methylthiotransferase MiaB [Thermoguttaceae bacterium]
MPRRVYIETLGCQMNVLDSELLGAALEDAGYELVGTRRLADVVLLNTCSVRQHAEDKVYSALGRLKHLKEQKPGTVIGVLGCMAQKDRERIFRRAPHVDLVVGPGQLGRVRELIEQAAAGASPQMALSLDRTAGTRAEVADSFARLDFAAPPRRPAATQAMVRAMFGCDNFCTYCIVPSVRGPEQCRPAGEIVAEVQRLAGEGCIEVTLLGQTVNSYADAGGGTTLRLSDLLEQLNEIGGLQRIRFVTNHPKYMTDDLLAAVRDLDRVCPYLHVPAQSGSDAILARMKRGYTAGYYRDMLRRIYETIPGAAVTSDFIVGFCGETEADFQQTADLVREGRFKNSFIFKYSPRPGTKAAELFADDVPEEVKRRRNNELLALQNAISLEDNRRLIGRRVEVLVEGPSKTARKRGETGDLRQLVGRTACDRIVVFNGPTSLTGRLAEVEIDRAEPVTLFGRLP